VCLDYFDFGEDIFPIKALFEESMTAIARIHAPEGFVIAADGRALHGSRIRDDETKIMSLNPVVGAMSCAGAGIGSIGMIGVTKIIDHAMGASFLIGPDEPINFEHYLELLAERVRVRVRDKFPKPSSDPFASKTAKLFLDGFFRGRPVRGCIEIIHDPTEGARAIPSPEEITTGKSRVYGWEEIWASVRLKSDPTNLRDAIETVKAVIEAHCVESEELKQKHRELATIWPWGGHIHMATVTLANGFQWVPGFEPKK